jgi:hypothetical protein
VPHPRRKKLYAQHPGDETYILGSKVAVLSRNQKPWKQANILILNCFHRAFFIAKLRHKQMHYI